MDKTQNFEFNIPSAEDYYNVEDYNENFRKIDGAIKSSQDTQDAIDLAYTNSNQFTEQKLAELVNGAPENLNTLKELAEAIASNDTVMDAVTEAIGKKASQAELDTHTSNGTIHLTASERTKWNGKQDKITVDSALNENSVNPVQNKAVTNAIDQVNSNLGGVRFGVDADGNYGYKKVGADTVYPFSGPLEFILKALPTSAYYGQAFFIKNTENYKKMKIIHNGMVHSVISVYSGIDGTGTKTQIGSRPPAGTEINISGSKSFEILAQGNDLSQFIKVIIS